MDIEQSVASETDADPEIAQAPSVLDDLAKHLEFIQTIVARMAGNSFLTKSWSVTLMTALVGVAIDKNNAAFALIAVAPALVFWGMDAYFLRQERLYRSLYDDVRRPLEAKSRRVEPFSLSTSRYQKSVQNWWRTTMTPSLMASHFAILIAVVSVASYLVLR